MKKTAFAKPTKPLKKSCLKKKSKKPLRKLQLECDKLYQLAGKKLMPYSIISGRSTEVIHHFFTKQSSSSLRYAMENGVPLTHGEHFAHHIKCDPTIHATVIAKRGQKWYEDLLKKRKESVKIDRQYYEEIIKSLT